MIPSPGQENPQPGILATPPDKASEDKPKGRRKWLIMAGAFGPLILVATLLVWGTIRGGGRPGGIFVNNTGGAVPVEQRAAPDFSLTTFTGETVVLSGMRGKIVFIDFWASWCPPCRAEAQDLKVVSDAFANEDVEFVGIDVWDRPGEGRSFARRSGWNYPAGIDQNGVTTIEYGVKGLPEKFFVDRDGMIVSKFIGPISTGELTGILNEMLEKPS